jgi:hypothetical protein
MSNGNFSLQAVREAAFVAMTWVVAAMFPLMRSDREGNAWLWIAIGFCFIFFAIDAIRYGSRRRIIIRVVVPLVLLSLSSVLYWLGLWGTFLQYVRSNG